MNTKIEPTQKDAMPYEVATAMLTEPKARMTNRMRKTCNAARWKEYCNNGQPMFRECRIDPAPTYSHTRLVKLSLIDAERRIITPEEKTARRYAGVTWEQLHRWQQRAIRQRMRVQQQFTKGREKLDALSKEDVQRIRQLRFALALLQKTAEALEAIMDATEDEIKRREEQLERSTCEKCC